MTIWLDGKCVPLMDPNVVRRHSFGRKLQLNHWIDLVDLEKIKIAASRQTLELTFVTKVSPAEWFLSFIPQASTIFPSFSKAAYESAKTHGAE